MQVYVNCLFGKNMKKEKNSYYSLIMMTMTLNLLLLTFLLISTKKITTKTLFHSLTFFTKLMIIASLME